MRNSDELHKQRMEQLVEFFRVNQENIHTMIITASTDPDGDKQLVHTIHGNTAGFGCTLVYDREADPGILKHESAWRIATPSIRMLSTNLYHQICSEGEMVHKAFLSAYNTRGVLFFAFLTVLAALVGAITAGLYVQLFLNRG